LSIVEVSILVLLGKYKYTLIVAVGITVEKHLLSLAFVFVDGENNGSWS
jgi:hypothetical protein